jgi:hypothetical protein
MPHVMVPDKVVDVLRLQKAPEVLETPLIQATLQANQEPVP